MQIFHAGDAGHRLRRIGPLLATMMLGVSACDQPPVEQLEAAKASVERARRSGAPEYAKEEFDRLEEEFATAKGELTKQESVMPLLRSYAAADQLLIRVVEDGEHVAAKGMQAREAARIAALGMEERAKRRIASVKELLAHGLNGRRRAGIELIKQRVMNLESHMIEIRSRIEKGDFLAAEILAKTITERGEDLAAELSAGES